MNRFVYGRLLILWPLLAVPAGSAQDPVPSGSIHLFLEQLKENTWTVVHPQTVFRSGDEVRFRFTTTFTGYLYVLNETASHQYLWLFPTAETGTTNRLELDREYRIPATEGSFTIPADPGYDMLYWIVSPVMLSGMPDLSRSREEPRQQKKSGSLVPRCQTGPLRARGVCLDDSAGVRPVSSAPPWSEALPPVAALSARDLTFMQDQSASHITVRSGGPLIYEFRIGHR